MLDVPRAPPNGIIKEPANWVPLPDSAGSFLTQMTHPSPLHLEFCSGGGGHIKTQLHPKILSSSGFYPPRRDIGRSSVKCHHNANMLTWLCLSRTSKTCGEGKLCSRGSRSGMELNALLHPGTASGHDTGPTRLIHQIRLPHNDLLLLLKDMLSFTFL